MKDESRELIEQYKDMYQKLNEQSIFSLRTYGREIGVAQPTLKKKEELIIHNRCPLRKPYKNHERIGSTGKAK